MLQRLGFALLCLLPLATFAQTAPRVLLDTDRGPILLELDAVDTPRTTANFLAYVDDGSFDNTLVHRIIRNFVVQGGSFTRTYSAIPSKGQIANELQRSPRNLKGSVAMALVSNTQTGAVQRDSATSGFFINTADNANLDGVHTVFGRVVYGLGLVEQLNNEPLFPTADPRFPASEPIRYPLIRRAVRTTGFPVLPLHSGSWYDPEKSGRGFVVEVSQSAAGAGNGDQPLLVVYWYDYSQGEQIWMNGVKAFSWGESEITVPLQITRGGQFGQAFQPSQVQPDANWGTVTLRFSGCDRGQFSFQSRLGSDNYSLRRITIPTANRCSDG